MKFPVNSLLAGNFGFPETSSLVTPSSSGESDANLTNTRRNSDRQAGRGYRSKAAKTALSPFI